MTYDRRFDHSDRARAAFRGGAPERWNLETKPINYRREIIGTGLSLLFFCAAMFGLALIVEEPGEQTVEVAVAE